MEFVDINACPPYAELGEKFLSNSVPIPADNIDTVNYTFGSDVIQLPTHFDWLERWRNTFLQVQYPSDHDCTEHYIMCLYVISSAENNALESIEILKKHFRKFKSARIFPKWFPTKKEVLNYFVLLHDVTEGNLTK